MDTIGLGRPCKICIDPGHGGRDSGCSHFGVNEKDPNLQIGLHLRGLLQQQGHTVCMTRENDSYVGLTDRGRYSVAKGSDLFVSVHHDSADAARRGCSSFVRYVEYRNGFDLGSRITTSLDEEFHHGFAYGTKCQKHWVNLGVLRGGNNDGLVTAMVVECACLSSAKDFEFIRQAGYPEKAAFAIMRGIHRHLGLALVGEPTEPAPRYTLVGIDGVARPGPWMGTDGYGYCSLRVAADAANVNVTWDGAKNQWTFTPKA